MGARRGAGGTPRTERETAEAGPPRATRPPPARPPRPAPRLPLPVRRARPPPAQAERRCTAPDRATDLRTLPLFHATTSIGFRRDLFAAAGIDPARIKTWDQLAESAAALTVTKDGRVESWGFGTPISTERTGGTTAITFMLQAAGPIWEDCKPRYAGPVGQRAVQSHIDMITKLRAMPREVISNHTDDITDQFIAGRYAMAVIPFARYEHIARTARWDGENLGILPWPNWTADRPGPQQAQGCTPPVGRRFKSIGKAVGLRVGSLQRR